LPTDHLGDASPHDNQQPRLHGLFANCGVFSGIAMQPGGSVGMLKLLGLDLVSNSSFWLVILAGIGLSILLAWIFDFILGQTGLGVIGNTCVVILSVIIGFLLYNQVLGRPRMDMAPALLAVLVTTVISGMFAASYLRRRAFS
jgi:hypothetical protein